MAHAGNDMLSGMHGFDFKRSVCGVACVLLAACGARSPDPAPASTAPAAAAPGTTSTPAATPATPEPSPPPTSAAHTTQRTANEAKPEAPAAKPVASKPDEPAKPRAASSARTQASLETEKLNRQHVEPSPVAAEPIAAAPVAEPSPTPAPEPAPQPPAAKPAAGKVVVPNTGRVRVEVPAGLQRWLDADTRMQPWLNKVIPVIDKCYGNVLADHPDAAGTITFRATMHQNARPDPDIQSLPGQLSGVVACATGQLMRTKMPLFTGTEGESYTVKVKFGD